MEQASDVEIFEVLLTLTMELHIVSISRSKLSCYIISEKAYAIPIITHGRTSISSLMYGYLQNPFDGK